AGGLGHGRLEGAPLEPTPARESSGLVRRPDAPLGGDDVVRPRRDGAGGEGAADADLQGAGQQAGDQQGDRPQGGQYDVA
ncbi:hypothetical protein CO181_01085, partial [candidate division WWE3 bacterium CG_4_9_14_3_um_filter_43_9]